VPRLEAAKAMGAIGSGAEEGTIAVYDEQDRLVRSAPVPGRPIDVAVADGRLYVTDAVHHQVQVLDAETLEVTGTIGSQGTGDEQFRVPRGVAVDRAGWLYVADMFNGRIKVFSPDGTLVSQYGYYSRLLGGFLGLAGLAVDHQGRVYAVDSRYLMKAMQDEVQIFEAARFYPAGEAIPSIDTPLNERRNALYGYFQKPYATGGAEGPTASTDAMYMPMDVAVDYENTAYFQSYFPPNWRIEYLIWLTSNFAHRGRNVSVFAYAVPE